jgi:hypothetical protein
MRELTRISHQTVEPDVTAAKVRMTSARTATNAPYRRFVYGQVAGSCPRTSRTNAAAIAGFVSGESTRMPPKSASGRTTATASVTRTSPLDAFFGTQGVTGFAVIDRSPGQRRRATR